jgi:hypothetical protein
VTPKAAVPLAGLLFGVGLALSGMTNPAKVIGFLDLFGRWDPSLALVMVGAIGVHFVLLRRILRRPGPRFEAAFRAPKAAGIDGRLVLGAAVFGVGWGLGGVCPGPGIVDAGAGSAYALVFTACMALGVVAARGRARARADAAPRSDNRRILPA